MLEEAPLFRNVSALTVLPVAKFSITFGELLDRFLKYIRQNRSETTFSTYQTPARVMREVLGEDTPLNAITRSNNCVNGEDVTASMNEDPMRKALIQMQSLFSELEKSLLVGKLRRARQAKKETTGKCEGRKAFGEKPGERQVVETMRLLRRKRNGQRMSFAKIATELNERNVPTRTGARWHTTDARNEAQVDRRSYSKWEFTNVLAI